MDEEMVRRINVLREKGKFTYDVNSSNLDLAFNTQRTLTDLGELCQLEQDLAAGMNGSNMNRLNLLVEAFRKNAPTLKGKLDFSYSEMTKAAPNALNMTAGERQLCLDFLNSMRQTLVTRALNFGIVLQEEC